MFSPPTSPRFQTFRGPRGLGGAAPAHEIDGDRIRFQQSDGSWGDWIIVPEPQAPGIRFTFSTTITDSDPGDGILRLSASQQDTSLTIRADDLDINGVNVAALLDALDDSTSAVKGHIRLVAAADTAKYIWYHVTAVVAASGYRNITVSPIVSSASSPFANGETVVLSFSRTGDAGEGAESVEVLHTAAAQGAVTDGVTDNVSAFNSLKALGGNQYIGPGAYKLASDVVWPDSDYSIRIHPQATFPGPGEPDFATVLLYHAKQIGLEMTRKTWGAEVANYPFGAFQFGQCAIANYTGISAVALYGQGIARAAGARAWGMNVAGIAEADATHTAAIEATAVNMHAGGSTVVLALYGKGTHGNGAAMIVASGGEVNNFAVGIKFDNDFNTCRESVIEHVGGTSQVGFNFALSTFTSAEINFPSFLVSATVSSLNSRVAVRGGAGSAGPDVFVDGEGATDAPLNLSALGANNIRFYTNGRQTSQQFQVGHVASSVNYLEALGAASGAGPVMRAVGANADIDLAVRVKGAGSGKLQDGAGANRFMWSSVGIGFNGTGPIAKPEVTGSRGGNAALASALSALASIGLITNSTTA